MLGERHCEEGGMHSDVIIKNSCNEEGFFWV